MSQEAITEIDMDVFSRRISPYLSWLESKIESGWEQSDAVKKDVLKETRFLATTMRARFILGVSKEDFTKEVARALELFELAMDAFPGRGDEVESRMQHLCKGVVGELGEQFIPQSYRKSPLKKADTALKPVQSPEVKISEPAQEAKAEEPKIEAEKPKVKKKPKRKVSRRKTVKKSAEKEETSTVKKEEPKVEAEPKKVKRKKAKVSKKPVAAKKKTVKKEAKRAKTPVKKKLRKKEPKNPSAKIEKKTSKIETVDPKSSKKEKPSLVKKWIKKFIYG